MGKNIAAYDPTFYAQEALVALEKYLGMSGRVHRGFDLAPQTKGSTIQIPVPSSFTVQAQPGTDQDVDAGQVDILLDQWQGVKFALTDKDLSRSQDSIIADHIVPAAAAIADDIDQKLCALYKDIPAFTGAAATTPDALADLTGLRQMFVDKKIPFDGRVHCQLDSAAEAKFLELFGANNAAGAAALNGSLGTKFGIELFANQNAPSHANGTMTAANASGTAGDLFCSLAAATSGGTITKGTLFTIADDTTQYVVTKDATCTTTTLAKLEIYPALAKTASSKAVTLIASHKNNLAFHSSAFALGTAPLSDMAKDLGAKVAVVTYAGLSIRSRIWYVGDSSAVKVGLDVLYGVKTLDPLRAVRLLG